MCTRIFWGDNSAAAVVSRTLDSSFPSSAAMWFLPAGLRRRADSAAAGLTWTSAYSSAALVDFGGLYLDGLNSAGLAAHTLMFTSAEYEPPDSRPVLTTGLWSQFVLDNCASVDEAVAALRAVRVEPTDVGGTGLGHALPDEQGRQLGVHLSVEDASGDTAVFEPVAGRMLVTHGRQYQVMANSPSMPEQLANLARYRPFGGDLPAPGDITSEDRFVRASYFRHYLPTPADSREALAGVVHVASAVSKPPGVPYPTGEVYPTRWISAADLSNRDYYFWSMSSPALAWASLADLATSAVPLRADLSDPEAVGDLVPRMRPAEPPALAAAG